MAHSMAAMVRALSKSKRRVAAPASMEADSNISATSFLMLSLGKKVQTQPPRRHLIRSTISAIPSADPFTFPTITTRTRKRPFSFGLRNGGGIKLPLPFFKTFLPTRSEEHTSELQSPVHLVCRLLLEKKKKYEDLPLLFNTYVVRFVL